MCSRLHGLLWIKKNCEHKTVVNPQSNLYTPSRPTSYIFRHNKVCLHKADNSWGRLLWLQRLCRLKVTPLGRSFRFFKTSKNKHNMQKLANTTKIGLFLLVVQTWWLIQTRWLQLSLYVCSMVVLYSVHPCCFESTHKLTASGNKTWFLLTFTDSLRWVFTGNFAQSTHAFFVWNHDLTCR